MRNPPASLCALPATLHRLADYELAFNARRKHLAHVVQVAAFTGRTMMARDGRGRFLSNAWLRNAETFTPSDLAWFRHANR